MKKCGTYHQLWKNDGASGSLLWTINTGIIKVPEKFKRTLHTLPSRSKVLRQNFCWGLCDEIPVWWRRTRSGYQALAD